jgi:hypothetical protein
MCTRCDVLLGPAHPFASVIKRQTPPHDQPRRITSAFDEQPDEDVFVIDRAAVQAGLLMSQLDDRAEPGREPQRKSLCHGDGLLPASEANACTAQRAVRCLTHGASVSGHPLTGAKTKACRPGSRVAGGHREAARSALEAGWCDWTIAAKSGRPQLPSEAPRKVVRPAGARGRPEVESVAPDRHGRAARARRLDTQENYSAVRIAKTVSPGRSLIGPRPRWRPDLIGRVVTSVVCGARASFLRPGVAP